MVGLIVGLYKKKRTTFLEGSAFFVVATCSMHLAYWHKGNVGHSVLFF
jgi:hypothetical protein